jgi:nitrous oxidase accessory protein
MVCLNRSAPGFEPGANGILETSKEVGKRFLNHFRGLPGFSLAGCFEHPAALAAFAILLLALAAVPALAYEGEDIVVSPDGPYTTIEAALADTPEGGIIEVRGGVYAAPLRIDRPVALIGVDGPVIDGKGAGSLVFISAPDVQFQGFTLRNTGTSLEHEDTAIVVQAPRVTIADNVLENVLFGIYFAQAPEGIARNNVIRGIDLDLSMRGDGIRVWYSDDVTLDGNEVSFGRDTLIWYANDITIVNNHFHDDRYGLHFMYSGRADIENNIIENNNVGTYLMYSIGLTMRGNTIAYSRGTSGYGLALKDMDEVVVEDNIFLGNRSALYIDNSPALYEGYNTFTGNLFAYNDVGMTMLPSVRRNVFQRNTFLENMQQAAVHGRGNLLGNVWQQDGVGNYWSDYVGYDADGDGVGDLPYRSEKLFDSLMDVHPSLRLFAFSPATQAIDFAAAAFPSLRPDPRLIDEAPMMSYMLPPQLAAGGEGFSLPMLGISLAITGLGGGITALALRRQLASVGRGDGTFTRPHTQEETMITAERLTKRYGAAYALDQVSFDIQPGEAVALWGANGAGKTTALRCLLGLLPFEGRLTVNGVDVRKAGKSARAAIGYVPQEAAFYDLTVHETLAFYARLKKVSQERIGEALDWVQLNPNADKPVRALSGGMKQRLALAVALLADPPILVLDEPTASLDAQARRDFIRMIQALNQMGKTVVFSSHRLDEVIALAGRVLVLNSGRLAFECNPAELAEKLGLGQWLRVQVASSQREDALTMLANQGFSYTPNGKGVYVHISPRNKMAALRLLEIAQIPVEDFDLVDSDVVPGQDGAE